MLRVSLLLLTAILLSACGSLSPKAYRYNYVEGRTARVVFGKAIAPDDAPDQVKAAIEAGNRIAGLPYCWGGGRCNGVDHRGYDCSGAVSYVLREAGLLGDWMTSRGFRDYGRSGPGKWISVYARNGHVFMVVAGVRFDTGWGTGASGPRWTTRGRPAKGCVVRHPSGL